MTNENIARVCHEANRAYCLSLGDTSQPSWKDAPNWQRKSAIGEVGAHLKSDLTPEQSHESWLKEKEIDGWRYGPVKDLKFKTHPCFVSYNELPEDQKVKDLLFSSIVSVFK